MRRRPSARSVVLLLAAGAGGGILVFFVLVWRAVSIELADASLAQARFTAIRATFGSSPPLVEIDDSGRVTKRASLPREPASPVTRVKALAYQPNLNRLVQADSPFWFLKLKGPAAQLALRETGVDLDDLGITPADLERYGPGIVIDHTSRAGARLMVWTA